MSPCEIVRLDKETILGLLHREQEFAEYFLSHLLTRTARVEADLVDQLFNSSEMRLARALLLLANYGGDLGTEPVPIKVNQETLAALIGTTRSRVNLFMNKFRKLGLIDYNGKLEVRKALLNYVLNERPHIFVPTREKFCAVGGLRDPTRGIAGPARLSSNYPTAAPKNDPRASASRVGHYLPLRARSGMARASVAERPHASRRLDRVRSFVLRESVGTHRPGVPTRDSH
jgi:hypothetical protein